MYFVYYILDLFIRKTTNGLGGLVELCKNLFTVRKPNHQQPLRRYTYSWI